MSNNERKVQKASSRFLAKDRLSIFAGEDMPQTIVMKELADNTIDVVAETKMPATQGSIHIGPSRIRVMDNGYGISLDAANDEGETHLWLSMAEMFTSSNYEGVAESVGNNGVGLTIASMTALSASALIFAKDKSNVRGYSFTDGYLKGTEEAMASAVKYRDIAKVEYERLLELSSKDGESISKSTLDAAKANWDIAEQILIDTEKDGNMVDNPLNYETAVEKYNPHFKDGGFFLDLVWPAVPNETFEDEAKLGWLELYIKRRVGESKGKFELKIYKNNEFSDENVLKSEELVRDYKEEGSKVFEPNTVTDWEERVIKEGGIRSLYVNEKLRVAFFDHEIESDLQSMVQGAIVQNPLYMNYRFDINGTRVSKRIPYTFYYKSPEYPKYLDQTKVGVRLLSADNAAIVKKFESSPLFQHYYKIAEMEILKAEISSSKSEVLWPALGPVNEAELIIGEGFSAISGVKARRNPLTQACIGLRGKIKNTWRSSMNEAVKSPIVKELLNEIMNNDYKQIIIATDADDDGFSITTLLLALIANYTDLLQKDKIKLVYTPHYIFRKGSEPIKWSENAGDCPKGWSVTVNKGLGSLQADEIEAFITDPKTRKLVNVLWNEDTDEGALDFAMIQGGEPWIR